VHPVLALSGGTVTWYIARATGVVTLGFLTASVLLGILTSFRWSSPTWPRFVVEFVHRNVSLLVLVFLAIHVVTVVADSFAPIRWIDVVIPFVSAYRPFWLGLGAVACDLLIALVVTSLLRHRIGFTTWRFVHWLAYLCWPVAVLHGLGTGSDTRTGLVLAFTAACVVMVLVAAGLRVGAGLASRPGGRALGFAAVTVGPVLLVLWLVSGPLADGWARKAGTPGSVLAAVSGATGSGATGAAGSGTTGSGAAGAAASSSGGTSAPTQTGAFPAAGFDATVRGTLRERAAGSKGQVVVSLAGTLSNGATGSADVELTGTPLSDGGVSMSSGTVTPSDGANSYRGAVVGLGSSQVLADMPGPGGASWRVSIDFTQLDQQRGVMAADVHVGRGDRVRPGGDDGGSER
jgi:DMSO/TMAO reductase YedYZ heme-binding membrane subunit